MQYRRLGRTGLKISEVTYGSWLTFGNQVELDAAKEIVERAFALGVNSFDTADVYKAGEAETLLGQILPKRRRSEYVVATKAFWPMSDHVTDRGLSRKHLFDSIDASLERLHLRNVDIFYCHRFDPETPLAETIEALDDLIRLGKIVYWGTSEWTAAQIREANALCRVKNWHAPVVGAALSPRSCPRAWSSAWARQTSRRWRRASSAASTPRASFHRARVAATPRRTCG
jgi:aryl-alcohol dehydrogenase-like predicted oxidoreductase